MMRLTKGALCWYTNAGDPVDDVASLLDQLPEGAELVILHPDDEHASEEGDDEALAWDA